MLAVPVLGAKGALLLVAAGYLLAVRTAPRWPLPASVGLAMVSAGLALSDAHQALLPLVLHPGAAARALPGPGHGRDGHVRRARPHAAGRRRELLPEVIATSALFTGDMHGSASSTLRVVAPDARRYVRTSGPRYGLIVSDNFHPARTGRHSSAKSERLQAVEAV